MKLAGKGDDSHPLGLTEKNALILQSERLACRSLRGLSVRSGRADLKRVKVKPVAVASDRRIHGEVAGDVLPAAEYLPRSAGE